MELLSPVAASDDGQPPTRTLRDELSWVLPISLAVAGTVFFLFLSRGFGPDLAAILALPVEALGVIVAVLGARGTALAWGPRRQRRPARGRRRWLAAATASTVLAVLTVAYYRYQREPDPDEFMSGVVRIGYIEPGYPGWSEAPNTGGRGFDISVASAIVDYFPRVAGVEWVALDHLDQRIDALRGPWGPHQLAPVHLVVNNFSITEARRQQIDFAGPYFQDEEGFATQNPNADSIHDLRRVCVPAGSTGEERLKKLGIPAVVDVSVRACFQRFFSRQDPDLAVSTDLAVLQAYVASQPQEKRRAVPHFVSVGGEQYGVGLPNNRPKLCAKVNEALQKFLDIGWGTEFDATLGKLKVPRTLTGGGSRQPTRLAPCEPTGSWLK